MKLKQILKESNKIDKKTFKQLVYNFEDILIIRAMIEKDGSPDNIHKFNKIIKNYNCTEYLLD